MIILNIVFYFFTDIYYNIMVKLSLANGINSSGPLPLTGINAQGSTIGLKTFPTQNGTGYQINGANGAALGQRLLPFTIQTNVNQAFIDSIYKVYGSRLNLDGLYQISGMEGFGTLSTSVNTVLGIAVTAGNTELNAPIIAEPKNTPVLLGGAGGKGVSD
jgi:hypothetical protein